MLTICIPIFNNNVNKLVDVLAEQCEASGIMYQILCFDDASSPEYKALNSSLGLKFNVNYTELSDNHGRSKIRNKMAKLARFENLLFLDSDSVITDESFISGYLDHLNKHVVYGGRTYSDTCPDNVYSLHWTYGRKVESMPLKQRNENRTNSFMSNNFLVKSFVLSECPFDETIQGYGYEDLEWAQRLVKRGVLIHHIDNSVEHGILDDNPSFLAKTKVACRNLAILHKDRKVSHVRLLNFYHKIHSWGMLRLVLRLLNVKVALWEQQLSEGQVSLWKYQWLKLYYFAKEMEQSDSPSKQLP